ncbi:hypothetical protein HYPSUDRAFT_220624 [Hypholoma sublateritium FD-334 SS-4]|uniref:Uncharacterized protein n=1 Tax=Hypholoma sublateritium (strain FD-334 SS-4) TaxID=945553 RepID=A0A0D2N4R4_HYPSF|nr:hypothetical protein HYPSUDRAFT_220624 [Hypholoma sublateritium FD-334 SS-4]
MLSIRMISMAAALLGSLAVNAAVNINHARPGAVFMAQPLHFDPPVAGHSTHSGTIPHPVIAIGHADHEGWVPVAQVSHNPPAHMGETHGMHHYDEHTHAAGLGSFSHGSRVAVGQPTHVHIDNLNHVTQHSGLPHRLHETDTANLQHAVYQASGFHSSNPRIATPPARTPPWRAGH